MSRKYFVEAEPMELELPPPLPAPTADPSLRGVESIKISAIRPNPSQPRVTFEPASLSALADSIAQHGIIQPLTVRKLQSGYYQIIAGERRWRAARMAGRRTDRLGEYELVAGERRLRAASIAGLSEVPCIVCEIDRRRSAYLAIIENIQRSDLDMFEEAAAIFSLSSEHGMTQGEIARILSCSQSSVANKLRLLRLSDAERKLITENSLTERHARAFLRLSDPERRLHAISLAVRGKMNVAATEELVEAMLREDEIRLALQEIPEDKPHGKRHFVLKDIRLFYNSIEHAMDIVRLAGIKIQSRRIETDECTELRILIHKGS